MTAPSSSLRSRPFASLLLATFKEPASAGELTAEQWDGLVRTARSVELLATLLHRFGERGLVGLLPPRVLGLMQSEAVAARYRRQMVLAELRRLESALSVASVPVVLLKGASYIAQSLPVAAGRMVTDVDILVPRERLRDVERSLRDAGWRFEELDRYDERYYRDWAHELPPMRYPGEPLELDVHHNILQRTARLHPDAGKLVQASIAVEGSGFRVLCPEDQVLHAAVHLFQDSDCAGRLRDLIDIDGLMRAHGGNEAFWENLRERARLHGVARPLWYALHFCRLFLDAPIPVGLLETIHGATPSAAVRRIMGWLVTRALLPTEPDERTPLGARAARALLYARSHWLRMPPWLLAWHLGIKSARRLHGTPAGAA